MPKKETKTSKPSTAEIKPSRAGSYELVVTKVDPDSVPPGGHGQVVLVGEGFKNGVEIRFSCPGGEFAAENVKVDSPTKVEVLISVPVTAQEGTCNILGTNPEKEVFRISNSGNMPISLPSMLLGEGDLQFIDLMMKMQQAMSPGFGKQSESGRIELDSSSIKYVQGGKATFTESISGVKSMAEMKQAGQPIGIFRIVFNDGKIYNFGGTQQKDTHAVFEFLQKKLGK
jgi:hypothetical protein